MSYGYGDWAPYVSVAEQRVRAERKLATLRKKDPAMAPVVIAGKKIASSFWGKAWCDAVESYRDYANRLERGRSYVRNNLVIDLRIAPGKVTAQVSGSEVYKVTATIAPTPPAQWQAICADCTGRIDSLVELLQGKFSDAVMQRLCGQESGLFPKPSEIKFSCSCPDYAGTCKHVAAVLYGVGARLDKSPELLFRLRAVDETMLLAGIGTALPSTARTGNTLDGDDLAALFGLEMAGEAPAVVSAPVTTAPAKKAPAKKAAVKKAGVKKAGVKKAGVKKAAGAAKPVPAAPPKSSAKAKAEKAPKAEPTPAKPKARAAVKAKIIAVRQTPRAATERVARRAVKA